VRIEHIALNVERPVEVAAWYCRCLGFTVKRSIPEPHSTYFLADESGETILELYCNPTAPVPDYFAWPPLTFHIAFVCDDIPGTVERLRRAGARVESPPSASGADELAMMRDPFGLCIQLARRASPLRG